MTGKPTARTGAKAPPRTKTGSIPLDVRKLRFREVTRDTWKDFERLFESPGAPKYCWCMAWRADRDEVKQTDGASKKRQMKKRVMAGVPVGLVAYLEEEPIAWCSVAPRTTYRELGGVTREGEKPERIWSVVCFFVKRAYRGSGTLRRLLKEAERQAKRHGASALEAYPVDPASPSYRFMGFKPVFDEAGFDEVGRAGSRRYVMRKPV